MREGMEEREAATGLSEAREAAEAIAELWNARPEAIAKGHALKIILINFVLIVFFMRNKIKLVC